MIEAIPNINLISKRDKPKNDSSNRLHGFINILTTQLQNQDPTAPMEAKDLSQLLTGLITVEQNSNSNLYLKELLDLQKEATSKNTNTNTYLNGAVSYLGRSITANCDRAQLTPKGANFTYNLSKDASQVLVKITDKNHQVIFERELGNHKSGLNSFLWSGEEGNIDDYYDMQVYAVDKRGHRINVEHEVTGKVRNLEITDEQKIYLVLDNSSIIDLSQISSVF